MFIYLENNVFPCCTSLQEKLRFSQVVGFSSDCEYVPRSAIIHPAATEPVMLEQLPPIIRFSESGQPPLPPPPEPAIQHDDRKRRLPLLRGSGAGAAETKLHSPYHRAAKNLDNGSDRDKDYVLQQPAESNRRFEWPHWHDGGGEWGEDEAGAGSPAARDSDCAEDPELGGGMEGEYGHGRHSLVPRVPAPRPAQPPDLCGADYL